MNSVEESYNQHVAWEANLQLPSRYTAPNSVDNWRHTRMLDSALPLIAAYGDSNWITVGDGGFGSDASYLHSKGVKVTATSLTDRTLRVAFERGFIPGFRAENAEKISYDDESVDFVLCKEAYHHFPRPPVALYEMLRVAKQGVVLIEPVDNPSPLGALKTLAKRMIRGDGDVQFEPSGNFIYRINLREMEKLMTAMGLKSMAFKGINDFYHPRFGGHDAQTWNMGSGVTRFGIGVQNALCSLGLLGYGLGCVIVFRAEPTEACRKALASDGFKLVDLPRNPFSRSTE